MNLVLVDTDVVSFHFKNDPRAEPHIAEWAGKTLVVSFMTLAELQFWRLSANGVSTAPSDFERS
jgi:predicted nucleic acid-binding protein